MYRNRAGNHLHLYRQEGEMGDSLFEPFRADLYRLLDTHLEIARIYPACVGIDYGGVRVLLCYPETFADSRPARCALHGNLRLRVKPWFGARE